MRSQWTLTAAVVKHASVLAVVAVAIVVPE